LSTSPARISADFATLRRLGFRQILLWGSDYWLRRSKQGDERWLQAVKALLKRRWQPAHHLAGG
jgi:hypothetical protein